MKTGIGISDNDGHETLAEIRKLVEIKHGIFCLMVFAFGLFAGGNLVATLKKNYNDVSALCHSRIQGFGMLTPNAEVFSLLHATITMGQLPLCQAFSIQTSPNGKFLFISPTLPLQ